MVLDYNAKIMSAMNTYLIWFSSWLRWEPAKTSREEVFSAMILYLELLAREPETQVTIDHCQPSMSSTAIQVSGIAALVDMSGLCWSHWKQLSVDYISCMVATVQGAFPIRSSSSVFNIEGEMSKMLPAACHFSSPGWWSPKHKSYKWHQSKSWSNHNFTSQSYHLS